MFIIYYYRYDLYYMFMYQCAPAHTRQKGKKEEGTRSMAQLDLLQSDQTRRYATPTGPGAGPGSCPARAVIIVIMIARKTAYPHPRFGIREGNPNAKARQAPPHIALFCFAYDFYFGNGDKSTIRMKMSLMASYGLCRENFFDIA